MAWTDERIDTAEEDVGSGHDRQPDRRELGGVSRNAVIGKAHRLGLEVAPVAGEAERARKRPPQPAAPAAAAPANRPTRRRRAPQRPAPARAPPPSDEEVADPGNVDARPRPQPMVRSIGPGGFQRQNPRRAAAPITPAPPRRLVPAKPSADMAGKTSLLDLNDKICKWPLGHPGEPDFHFCGDQGESGLPLIASRHCGLAAPIRRSSAPRPPSPAAAARRRPARSLRRTLAAATDRRARQRYRRQPNPPTGQGGRHDRRRRTYHRRSRQRDRRGPRVRRLFRSLRQHEPVDESDREGTARARHASQACCRPRRRARSGRTGSRANGAKAYALTRAS
jgi:GcrA cell cycle regulator